MCHILTNYEIRFNVCMYSQIFVNYCPVSWPIFMFFLHCQDLQLTLNKKIWIFFQVVSAIWIFKMEFFLTSIYVFKLRYLTDSKDFKYKNSKFSFKWFRRYEFSKCFFVLRALRPTDRLTGFFSITFLLVNRFQWYFFCILPRPPAISN